MQTAIEAPLRMSLDDDDLLREFLLECSENLNKLDSDFVALERSPADRQLLAGIFRGVHTIKGNAGFFGFGKLEALTHVGETLLVRLRDGVLDTSTEITTALLAMVDGVRRILASIEAGKGEGDEDHAAVIAELSRVGGAKAAAKPGAAAPVAAVVFDDPAELVPEASPEPMEAIRALAVSDASIRVDVGLLDRVMNLVGELVLARNQILQFGAASKNPGLLKASQRLNLLTSELQEGVMKTRMQPIGNVWNKFPRVVRDLAQACGKQVNLELHGTDTELDRTIIEAIKDPMTHAVRNAVDHGVETAARRRAAGKAETATVLLRAFHEGGQVNIEVSDDGGGLDLERIRARAVERGLVPADRAVRMTEREIAHLIFLPGFSTAETVTNVSGRGVGMDVVKTNIEQIGGTVDIASRPGQGTTLKIRIPLTLAIIPALVVTCSSASPGGGPPAIHRFAIPQVSLLELVRLEGPEANKGIERLHDVTVHRLRGNLLPIVFLHETLGLPPPPEDSDVRNIVVVQVDDRQFGLVVDGIVDTEEIVVKPLGKELKSVNVFAGATIMGDGRVALILDVPRIAQRANVLSASRAEKDENERNAAAAGEPEVRESLLLFRVGSLARMAVPLALVARLEEVDPGRVELSGGREVIQYRGSILPLVALHRELREDPPRDPEQPLQIIVCAGPDGTGGHIGIVVEQILDVVEQPVSPRGQSGRGGLLRPVVVQGKVADLLDVDALLLRIGDGTPARIAQTATAVHARKDAA